MHTSHAKKAQREKKSTPTQKWTRTRNQGYIGRSTLRDGQEPSPWRSGRLLSCRDSMRGSSLACAGEKSIKKSSFFITHHDEPFNQAFLCVSLLTSIHAQGRGAEKSSDSLTSFFGSGPSELADDDSNTDAQIARIVAGKSR
jgi:hypothetical protein